MGENNEIAIDGPIYLLCNSLSWQEAEKITEHLCMPESMSKRKTTARTAASLHLHDLLGGDIQPFGWRYVYPVMLLILKPSREEGRKS